MPIELKSSCVKVSAGVSVGGTSQLPGISGSSVGGTSVEESRFTEIVCVKILVRKCGSVTVSITEVSDEKVTYPGSHFVRLAALVVPVQKSQVQTEPVGALREKFTWQVSVLQI